MILPQSFPLILWISYFNNSIIVILRLGGWAAITSNSQISDVAVQFISFWFSFSL